jgi:hypothetical protein
MFWVPHHDPPKVKAAAPSPSQFEEGIALTKERATDPDVKVRHFPGEALRYYVLVEDWVINRNEATGRITDRSFGNLIFYRGDGKIGGFYDQPNTCYALNCGIREEDIHGNWGKPEWNCGYAHVVGDGGCTDVAALRPSDG